MGENDDGLCDISELQISLDSLRPDENVESTPVGSPRELSPGAKVVRTLQFIDTGSLSRVTSIEEKLSSVLALEPSTLKQQFEDLVFELPENDDSEVLEKLAHAEQKIIELQQEILKLERSLFLVNQNCAKKNHVLKNATNMLSTAKTLFLDENEKNKIKIMQQDNGLKGMMEILTELETDYASLKIEKENIEFKLNEVTLERKHLQEQHEEGKTERSNIEKENNDLTQQLETLKKESTEEKSSLNQKIANLKKLLESERSKVASFERCNKEAQKKTAAVQHQFELLKFQTDQAKSAREQHLKATQIEKEKISKVKADLEAKVTEIESGLKAAQNERVAAERSLEKCQKELQKSLEANQQLNAQLKTEKSTNEAELRKRETFHTALLQKRLAESEERQRQAEEALLNEFHAKEMNLKRSIDELRKTHAMEINNLEKSMRESVNNQMKQFLQNHYTQGLNAIGIDNPGRTNVKVSDLTPVSSIPFQMQSTPDIRRRSSSPVTRPVDVPSLADMSRIDPPQIDDSPKSSVSERELLLRSMLQKVLVTQANDLQLKKPVAAGDMSKTSSNPNLKSQLHTLLRSETLSQKERKSVEKFCKILDSK